jgi:hypothetical protein
MNVLLLVVFLIPTQPAPPTWPTTVTAVVSGNSWKGTTLDGTYPLAYRAKSRDWRYDLPAPVGGVAQIRAVYVNNGLGRWRFLVRAMETSPNGSLTTRHGWAGDFHAGPVDLSSYSETLTDVVGYAGPAVCPVHGQAQVDAP